MEFQVGIVGYGWVAGAHIAAINAIPGARVAAVCSSRALDPAELSARPGSPIKVYRDLDAMLADPAVNVVSICSYPPDHPAQAIAAARAGKHLIIEKPVGLTWDDCVKVEAAVREAGVATCVCFECRYSSQFQATRSLVEQGMLGTIHYGEVDYYHGIGPWYAQYRWNTKREIGGSSLLSAGCHALDGLLLFMGPEVDEVASYSSRSSNASLRDYEYDTTSVTILKFRDGSVGKVASSIDCLQPYYFHVHLVGSEGSLLDDKFYSTRISGLNRGAWSRLSMKLLDSGDVTDHPYQAQFQAFFDAIRAGTEMPLTSLRQALQSHRVIFAADRSAESGKPVRPDEVGETG
jgi:predicted dehydrogenase